MLDNIELIPGEKPPTWPSKDILSQNFFFQEISSSGESTKHWWWYRMPSSTIFWCRTGFNQFQWETWSVSWTGRRHPPKQETGEFSCESEISLAQELEISLEIEKSTPRQLFLWFLRVVDYPEPEKLMWRMLNQTPPEESVLLPGFCDACLSTTDPIHASVLNASCHVGGAQRLAILGNNVAGSNNGLGCGLKWSTFLQSRNSAQDKNLLSAQHA